MNKTKTRQKIDDALREIELGGRAFVELDDLEQDVRAAVSRRKRKSRGLDTAAFTEAVADLVTAIAPVLGRKPKKTRKSARRKRVEPQPSQRELEAEWKAQRARLGSNPWHKHETKAR